MLDVPRTQELVVCVGARAAQNNGVLQVRPGAGRLLSMSTGIFNAEDGEVVACLPRHGVVDQKAQRARVK